LFPDKLGYNKKMKTANKGFTLIELLVVIAIIGILSGIVLVALGISRDKAKAAAVQGELGGMRSQADLFFTDKNHTYGAALAAAPCPTTDQLGTMFDSGAASNLMALLAGVNTQLSGDLSETICAVGTSDEVSNTDVGSSWAVSAPNPAISGNYFCVDSTGISKEASWGTATEAVTQDTDSARCS
jgi:type IV pilus assembly protein PilA